MRLLTKFIKGIVCSFFYRVKYHNEEVLDKYDSYLICPNHSHVLDAIFVFPTKYERSIYIMAKQELFKNAIFRWLAKLYNVFSIDRENTDVRSMLKSLSIFKNDDKAKLIIFPEGKVVKIPEEVGVVYKKGAVFIAAHINKPIIPVYITRRPKLFQRIDITFGEPFEIKDIKRGGGSKIDNISKELINCIYSLNKENDK